MQIFYCLLNSFPDLNFDFFCFLFFPESSSCYKSEDILQKSKESEYFPLFHAVYFFCLKQNWLSVAISDVWNNILEPTGLKLLQHSASFSCQPATLKTNRRLTSEPFVFAATAVRQLRGWGFAGLPAPLSRLRLSLRWLLPCQRPLLRLGWTELLSLLSNWQKVQNGPVLDSPAAVL